MERGIRKLDQLDGESLAPVMGSVTRYESAPEPGSATIGWLALDLEMK